MEGFVHPDFAPVTEKMQHLMSKRSAIGGMAVAVYHHGELVVDAWTGVRDAAGTPWQRDTMSISFSTTKGVVATLAHRLADRGLLDYDARVAEYWPEFAAGGKEHVTVRHLLSHQAAMHDVRRLASTTEELLDWDTMTAKLAAASPEWEVGRWSGYHALTYGWLVGEVIRRVTGLTVNEALQQEIAKPLGVEGEMYIGVPVGERDRVADLLVNPKRTHRSFRLIEFLARFRRYQPLRAAMVIDDAVDVFGTARIHDGEIPGANGSFTARSLATMYSALITPPAAGADPYLSAATLERANTIQHRLGPDGSGSNERVGKDRVLGFEMKWRLGYHLAPTTAGVLPSGFGHFGLGGSGAWADPESGLAIAMVLNRVGGTPIGDTQMLRLGGAAVRAAERRHAA